MPSSMLATRIRILATLVLFAAAGRHEDASAGSVYDITIDTSSLAGQDSTLAFDFISGGGPSNTLTIADFSTDGALGSSGPNSGFVTGALPGTITLNDVNDFFNEDLQAETLGSTISFQVSASANAPTGSALPDTFSFFLLNSTASTSLVNTTDPTGGDSLITFQIDGTPNGSLGVYSSSPSVSVSVGTAPIPLPASVVLLLSGVAAMGLCWSRGGGYLCLRVAGI